MQDDEGGVGGAEDSGGEKRRKGVENLRSTEKVKFIAIVNVPV